MAFRNYPPEHGIRVPLAALDDLVRRILRAAGLDEAGAAVVAGHLVATDGRCVFSHGTRKLEEYLPKLRDGRVNPRPAVRAERDEGATAVVDGDGGLGHQACDFGMRLAIAKARAFGVGAVTTWNHYHFGSAGKWTRLAVAADCIGLATSSHRFRPSPDRLVTQAVGSSPVSIGIPAGDQPPMVLDMGAGFLPHTPELMETAPMALFKVLGIGSANVMLGGLLAGIWRPEVLPPRSRWESNQGSFLTAWNVAAFMEVPRFKALMDDWVARARRMQPVPGFDRAELPGGLEWSFEREAARGGVLLADEHRDLLEGFAREAGEATPFAAFEATRF